MVTSDEAELPYQIFCREGRRERVERDRRIEIEGLRLKPPQFLCVKK